MSYISPFSLSNKLVIITGASSGIGRQCATSCAEAGARIVLLGRNMERLEETRSHLCGEGHSVICADLTDFDDVTSKLSEVISSIGPADGFIHAAGIEKTLPLKNLKPQDFIDVFSTNLIGGINILKFVSKKKNFNPGFKAVFISSITALIARVGTLVYTASKGAVVSATRELAVELAPKKINVNCISPGTVLTPMMEKVLNEMTDEDRQKRLNGFPLGLGRPEDVAYGCVYLLSDAARWITGQNLVIDGGFTAQ